ncbi:SHOCT domain-containing protein [Streptomyces rhizoryzae]|uniref:SHOCT domain-containing protein n=1 Tax=Streptomyces rhizoryzae TaxID=2932493 RepID=UPI0027E4311D|nr:SHOCT domain-containing protein [Streptomyces rhizoryzae]
MMFWYGHGGGWGWPAAMLGMVLFWALVITVGILVFRALARPGPHGGDEPGRGSPGRHPGAGPGAEQILAERYARGEIEDEEYHRRLAVLRTAAQAGAQRGATGSGGAARGWAGRGGEGGPGAPGGPRGPGEPAGPGGPGEAAGPGGERGGAPPPPA